MIIAVSPEGDPAPQDWRGRKEASSCSAMLSNVAAFSKSPWRLSLRPSSKLETMVPKASGSISRYGIYQERSPLAALA